MAKRFYRIGPAIWLEPWDDDMRMVAFYLLTCPHRTTEGLFRMPLEYARTDMRWTARRFDPAFSRLIDAGFVEHDAAAQVLLLVKALAWQAPANPNQITAAVRAIRELPQTPLLARFHALALTHANKLAEALAKALPERLGEPLVQRVANTPSPSQSPTPNHPLSPPPAGERKRQREEWEREALAWARAAGVTGSGHVLVAAVRQAAPWSVNGEAVAHFHAFVRQHFAGALEVAA